MKHRFLKTSTSLVLSFILLFTSCQKQIGTPLEGSVSKENFVTEAKAWLTAGPVLSEKKILDLPLSVLPEMASQRLFARMGKIQKKAEWDNAQFYNLDELTFLAVPITTNKKKYGADYEIAKAVVFYKSKTAAEIQMNVIEVISKKGESLKGQEDNIIATAFLNKLNHKQEVIADVNANVFFYNDAYRRINAFEFKNGLFTSSASILKNSNSNDSNSLTTNSGSEGCETWYIIYEEHNQDGELVYWEILYSYTTGNCTPGDDPEEELPEGEGGGDLYENQNIDGVDNICKSSFKFQQAISPTSGVGGWRVAGTTNIHMKIANLTNGQLVPIYLPTIYFGLPIFRADGTYYSENTAKDIAAEAVEYAEERVMAYYHSGGSLDAVGMALLFRQKINEKMNEYGGTATLNPGSNIAVAEYGKASYGWPIIGCL